MDTTQTHVKTVTATATFFGLLFTQRQLNNKHNINLLSHIWRKHRLQSHNIKYEYEPCKAARTVNNTACTSYSRTAEHFCKMNKNPTNVF